MKKRNLLAALAMVCLSASAQQSNVEVQTGSYAPEWKSLSQWECPEWFMDAKFGIWAHWGPQCHAEAGDWYARFMYYMGSGQQNWHWDHFGDPAEFGLKELCNDWKAQNWNPEQLINLYKSVGARYFMALGNHHDNFDLWNSPYQEWNSVNMGPKRDLLKEWSDACKKAGLPLGVSMHASHAWTWLEPSQDYDGNLTKEDGYKLNADGTEKWWKGYDPQELYAQNHIPSNGWRESGTIHSQWEWQNGASLPSEEYKQKFQNRVLQCINDYQPDMIYFDDTAMPFYGCDDNIGKNILSHYYNTSASQNGGTPQVVVTGKQLEDDQKDYMLWDVERGIPDRMQEKYWQTCTCIGSWHYDQSVYKNNGYKGAAQVIRMLVDIVSKNGNLLLSVPVRSDGTIDEKEQAILADIKAWMDINGESIYGTRTWKTFGEGPLAEANNPRTAQGFNEGQSYSSRDVRYVQKDGKVYATIMAWPGGDKFSFESFSVVSKYYSGKVTDVQLLGHGKVEFTQGLEGLTVSLPASRPNAIAPVFVITAEEDGYTAYQELQVIIAGVEEYLAIAEAGASYVNTGKPNPQSVPTLREAVETAQQVASDATDATVAKAKEALLAAFADFKANAMNQGGKLEGSYVDDITEEYFVEGYGFTREEGVGQRFGKPYYWTVENFSIPNGGDGTKKGLDNYSGRDALMLGVWNDAGSNQVGDLSNARIYRKVHLDEGKYYFGAAFNACYQLSADAYMFVSTALCNTSEIPNQAIACYGMANAKNDMQIYGLSFELEEEQDVYIGFQVDLLSGSATQEFRAEQVVLYTLPSSDLSELLSEIDSYLADIEESLGENTGYYSRAAWEAMYDKCSAWMDLVGSLSPEEELDLYFQVTEEWNDYLAHAHIEGGAPANVPYDDITIEVLSESSHFARTEATLNSGRFGAPLHWTVDNFGFGDQAGIDNYSGSDCLHLEVWWNSSAFAGQGYDITNTRIYQLVDLPAGLYYFGATYDPADYNDNMYIMATSELVSTFEIPYASIAYEQIKLAGADAPLRGITFRLEEDQAVYLGFQADLSSSSTTNLRVSSVKLLRYSDVSYAKLQELITEVITAVSNVHVNANTGHYSYEAYDVLDAVIAEAQQLGADADIETIAATYEALSKAYEQFIDHGRNVGGRYDATDATDITEEFLVEAYGFTRSAGGNDRFGTPLYWTVDNYNIPSNSEGLRGGLDKYPGRDHLTLGVWDDKQNAPEESDIANARVYRRVALDAGSYFFGATYETIYNLGEAYVFAATETLATPDIPNQSVAYMRIAECKSDGEFWGLRFTLDEPQEVLLGWQADLLNSSSSQEFRAAKVKLAMYPATDIEYTEQDEVAAPVGIYTLQGVRIDSAQLNALPRGLYIVNGKKVVIK